MQTENESTNKSYFQNPVYDSEGNVMCFIHAGEEIPAGGSLTNPHPERDPLASEEEIAAAKEKLRAERGDSVPAVESAPSIQPAPKKRGRPAKNPGVPKELKNQALVPRVTRERKPKLSKRSLVMKGLAFSDKQSMVMAALEAQYGPISFVDEAKHLFAQISYKNQDLFLKFKRVEKKNPDRSLMVSVYPADFRGKKVKPISRRYEKKGALFINRLFDMVDEHIAKKV